MRSHLVALTHVLPADQHPFPGEDVRARGSYEHLGWRPTGRHGSAELPPHPPQPVLGVTGAADG